MLNVFEEAAQEHRHRGYLLIALMLIVVTTVIVTVRLATFPVLPLLVPGALGTQTSTIHFEYYSPK